MLEQKDENKSVIEESDDINNKSLGETEQMIVVDKNEIESLCGNPMGSAIKPSFIDTFKASLIDLVVIAGVSAVAVYAADAILRIAGYSITQKFQMAFIIFMVVMVLYMSILGSSKKSNTIGMKISGLIITKG